MDPPGQLIGELLFGERTEAAAPVNRDLGPPHPQQPTERDAQQARLEVPQSGVDGGDGHRRDTRPALSADRSHHRRPDAGDVHRVAPDDHVFELVLDEGLTRRCSVRESQPARPAGLRLDDHHGDLVPGQRPVRLRLRKRDHVGGNSYTFDGGVGHPERSSRSQERGAPTGADTRER